MIHILLFLRKTVSASYSSDAFKAALLFTGLLWFSASGFLYFELPQKPDLRWGDALWWTLVTMATVGYGDLFPTTAGGRYLIGIPTMVFGIGFLGFIISSVASRLIETRSRRLQGMLQTHLTGHIIIFNYTRLEEVLALVRELRADESTMQSGICLVDERLQEIPVPLLDLDVQFVKGNPTDEEVLRRSCLDTAAHAIVLSRDRHDPHADDQNLVTVMVIEKLNPSIRTVVEMVDPKKAHQFELAGADSTVCVSEFAVNLIIQELQDPGVKTILEDLTSNAGGQQLYVIPVSRMGSWKFEELSAWGKKRQCIAIGVMRGGKPVLNCAPDALIERDDRAILIGGTRPAPIDTTA